MRKLWKVWLVVYVAFWVGYSIHMVGKETEPGKFTWTLPLQMLIVVGVPAIFGYLAGKERA